MNTIDLSLVTLKCWYLKVFVRVVDVETWRYVNIYSNLNLNFTKVGQQLTKITIYKKSISTLPEIILKHRKIIKFLVLLKYFLFVLFWADVAIMSTFVLLNFFTLFWCHLIAFIVLCPHILLTHLTVNFYLQCHLQRHSSILKDILFFSF